MWNISLKNKGNSTETYEAKRPTPPADWCCFQSGDREQGANIAPRLRVCHGVANARLISRLMSSREKKDVIIACRCLPNQQGSL